jgi:phosphoribosylformimino-5-aminoimidazole carboxamide ribotide isomerase
MDVAAILRSTTAKQLIVAGGIRERAEVDALDAMGVDAVAGMAVYSGAMEA